MGTSSKKVLGFDVSGDGIGANYISEIQQAIVSLKDGDFKIIPHPDGQGLTIATRSGDSYTIMNKWFVRTGLLKKDYRVLSDLTEIKGDGVYQNGRKL